MDPAPRTTSSSISALENNRKKPVAFTSPAPAPSPTFILFHAVWYHPYAFYTPVAQYKKLRNPTITFSTRGRPKIDPSSWAWWSSTRFSHWTQGSSLHQQGNENVQHPSEEVVSTRPLCTPRCTLDTQRTYSLGFDFGTSGARAAIISVENNLPSSHPSLLHHHHHHRLEYLSPSVPLYEQTPEAWFHALHSLCVQIPVEMRAQIQRIAVNATSGTVCGPRGAVKLYSHAEPKHVVEYVKEVCSKACAQEQDGGQPKTDWKVKYSTALAASSTLMKVVGWRRTMSENQSEDEKNQFVPFAHQCDLITKAILNDAPVYVNVADRIWQTDWHNALKLGWDPESGEFPSWISSLLWPRSSSCSSCTLRVHRPGDILGHISCFSSCGSHWLGPFHRDCVVVAGTTDSIAAFLASGANEIGDACTSLGSTVALKMLSTRRIEDPTTGVYSHRFPVDAMTTEIEGGSGEGVVFDGIHGDRDSGGNGGVCRRPLWLVGGASNCGCAVLREEGFSVSELEELSAQMDPSVRTGLDYYPLSKTARGERFPYADSHKAAILTPVPESRLHYLQAIFEGIARVESEGYARLCQLGAEAPRNVYSAGGGAVNKIWTAIRKEMIEEKCQGQVEMRDARHLEACVGTALLASGAFR